MFDDEEVHRKAGKVKLVDCWHYERSPTSCKAGSACTFRHREPGADKRYCPEWHTITPGAGASCPRGSECHFAHPAKTTLEATDCPKFLAPRIFCDRRTCRLRHAEGTRLALEAAAREGVPSRDVRVCPAWMRGFCRAGTSCPMLHPMNKQTPFADDFARLQDLIAPASEAPVPRSPVAPRDDAMAMVPLPRAAPVGGRGGGEKVITLWDIENCAMPAGISVATLLQGLREQLQSLRLLSPTGENEVKAFYNPRLANEYALPGGLASALHEGGVQLLDVGIKRGAADGALKEAVGKALRDARAGLRLSAIVIISSDGDFATDLRSIRMEGIPSVLIAGPVANDTLRSSADCVVPWHRIWSDPRGDFVSAGRSGRGGGVRGRGGAAAYDGPRGDAGGRGRGIGRGGGMGAGRAKTVVCRNFMAGRCSYGDACWFVHPTGDSPAEPRAGRGGRGGYAAGGDAHHRAPGHDEDFETTADLAMQALADEVYHVVGTKDAANA